MKSRVKRQNREDSAMSSEGLAISFVHEIREMLLQARHRAYAATNLLLVEAYWKVGQRIVEEEQQGSERAEWRSADSAACKATWRGFRQRCFDRKSEKFPAVLFDIS